VSASDRRPIHGVLDIVEVASSDRLVALGLACRRGVVLSIRQYPDGQYRYAVGSMLDPAAADEDDVPGIYDEEHLLPTGARTTAERYGPPAPFRLRDVVQISVDCDIEEARGCTGYVGFACSSQPGATPIGVWVYGLEEACIIDARYLTRNGVRLAVRPRGQQCTSTQVTADGEIVGHTTYVIVDDIEQYL
jgi:hypothetical protein